METAESKSNVNFAVFSFLIDEKLFSQITEGQARHGIWQVRSLQPILGKTWMRFVESLIDRRAKCLP